MLKFVRSTSVKGENKENTFERKKDRSATSVGEQVLIATPAQDWNIIDDRLYEAVKNRLIDRVLNLFNSPQGASVISPVKLNSQGDSSLHLCCELGNLDILSLLMTSPHANINASDAKGRTPLHRSLGAKQGAVSKFLMQNGASADAIDCKLMTPLHIAAANGDTECVQIMISNGANLEVKTKDGKTALAISAVRNQIDVADVLLNSDAKVDTVDAKGRTPLMLAALHGNREMVDFLVVRDADPSKLDCNSKTFIQLANEAGFPEAVEGQIAKMNKGSAILKPSPNVCSSPILGGKPKRPTSKPPGIMNTKQPVNPPRRRSSKLEPMAAVDPSSAENLTDTINSQISLASTTSVSSSNSSRLSIHEESLFPEPITGGGASMLSNGTAGTVNVSLDGKKQCYIKQLEKKNSQLMQDHSEMHAKLNFLEEQLKNAQMPFEASKKISDLEKTVDCLMKSLEDTRNGPHPVGGGIRHNTTSSSIAPLLLANNDATSSPNNFRHQQHQSSQLAVAGAGGGLLKPSDQRLSTAPGSDTYPETPDRSRGGPSEMSSSYLNYLNMNSSLAERQRHSQSSDSGYGGVSPTGSQNLIRNGPLDLRSEMTNAIQCLRELTANHYKLHELLENQSRSLQKITQTIIGLEQALPYLENNQSEQVKV